MARGLARTQIAAEPEDREQIASGGIFELRVRPGWRPEMAGIGHPMVYVLEDIEQMPLRHPGTDRLLEGRQIGGERLGPLALQVRRPVRVDRQLAVVGEAVVHLGCPFVEPLAQRGDQVVAGRGQSNGLTVSPKLGFAPRPGQEGLIPTFMS